MMSLCCVSMSHILLQRVLLHALNSTLLLLLFQLINAQRITSGFNLSTGG